MAGSKEWVRLPSKWITDYGLGLLPWKNGGEGADRIAALMTLTVIAHLADEETGVARVTYDQFCEATYLSRAKISNGLDVLQSLKVVEREPAKHVARSNSRITTLTLDGLSSLGRACMLLQQSLLSKSFGYADTLSLML